MSDNNTSEVVFPDNRLRRHFVMYTDGKQPTIDRLALVVELFGEMHGTERTAAIHYIADLHGFMVTPK